MRPPGKPAWNAKALSRKRRPTRMKEPTRLSSIGLGLLVAAALYTGPVRPSRAQSEPPVLAVAEIQYVDTSGEVIDQSADHFRRLRDIEADQLLDKAQAAGAAYLLISGFHKLSTLVQWAKFDIVDVKTRNVVFNRLVTFRGDDDKAWRHAESFIVREILDHEEK